MDDLSRLPRPPVAARRPLSQTRHGETIMDDYDWLRDADWRAVMRDPARLTPDIRAYLEAENAYTEAALAGTRDLQAQLVAEMRGRMAEDDSTVPQPDGAFEYYARFETGGEYPIYARRALGGGAEEIIVHGPSEAAGHDYYRIAGLSHSPDHRYAAIARDPDGSEECRVAIRDTATSISASASLSAGGLPR